MEKPRKTKQFWAVTEYDAQKVTGYECEGNPGYWWCPEVTFSGCEGIHLFPTERGALQQLVKNISAILCTQKELLEKTNNKLKSIP